MALAQAEPHIYKNLASISGVLVLQRGAPLHPVAQKDTF